MVDHNPDSPSKLEKNLGEFSNNWFETHGEWLARGCLLYKDNIFVLLQVTFVFCACNALTLGLLIGPLALGYFLIVMKLIDEISPPPQCLELFKGFSSCREKYPEGVFWNSLVFGIFWLLVTGLGYLLVYLGLFSTIWGGLLGYIFLLLIHTFFIFGIPYIADQGLEFWPATQASVALIKKAPIHFLIFSTVLLLGLFAGFAVLRVGLLLVMPIYFCAIAIAFRENVPRVGILEKMTRDRKL